MADSNTPDLRTVWFGLSPFAATVVAEALKRTNVDTIAEGILPAMGYPVEETPEMEAAFSRASDVISDVLADIAGQIKALPAAADFRREVVETSESFIGEGLEEEISDRTHEAAASQAQKVAAKMAKAAREAAEGTSNDDE